VNWGEEDRVESEERWESGRRAGAGAGRADPVEQHAYPMIGRCRGRVVAQRGLADSGSLGVRAVAEPWRSNAGDAEPSRAGPGQARLGFGSGRCAVPIRICGRQSGSHWIGPISR
jgi:hypothetical protein